MRQVARLTLTTMVAGLAWLLTAPGVAWAHAEVVATYPAGDTTPSHLSHVGVRFDEAVTLVPRALSLTTDRGLPVALDRPRLVHGLVLRADLQDKVAPGRYIVAWRVEADDGHIESGTFAFRVRAASATAMRPLSDGAPAHTAAPPMPAQPVWPVLVAAAIAVAAGLGAAVVVRRGLRTLSLGGPLYPPDRHSPSSAEHTTSRK